MLRLLARSIETALKLPVAAAWDVISLGNMGDGSSTAKVLGEHRNRKQMDDLQEVVDRFKDLTR